MKKILIALLGFILPLSISAQFINSVWLTNSTAIYQSDLTKNVGVGTASPDAPFTISSSTTIPSAPTSLNGLKFFFNTALGEGSIHSTNSIGTNYLTFYTSTGGSSGEKMRIAGNGNVGIGTTTPTDKLTIQGGAISFNNPANLLPYVGIDYDQTLDGLRFRANVASVALNTTNMFMSRITGNFGIGLTAPTSTLHNNGSEASNVLTLAAAATLGNSRYVIAGGGTTYLVTLPAASTCNGRMYTIRTNGIAKTISTYTTTTGLTSTTLALNSVITLVSDGTSWQQFQ